MQGLTDPPRTGLTAEQVVYLLTEAPAVAYERGVEILDATLNVLADISTALQGGTVERTMDATIHGTCSLRLSVDIDYETQLLRPYLVVTDGVLSARFNCGVYVAHKPKTAYGTTPVSNQVTGSDRLFLLNRPVGDAYTVAAGTGYLAAVQQVISDAGLSTSTVLLDSTAADKVLPTDKTWPMIATPKTTGTTTDSGPTTWLHIVNSLLASINYRGVWADENGIYRSQPYVTLSTRPIDYALDFDDPEKSIVSTRSVADDISTVPNKWVFVQQNLVDSTGNPIEPVEGAGQYTVVNQSTGPTSIDRRSLKWVSVVSLDAADQTTLVAQGNAQVAADRRVARVFTVTTAPFPLAWHWDVYAYTDNRVGASTVESVYWSLSLGTGATPPTDMEHTWEAVA